MKRWLLIPLGAAAIVLVWLALVPEQREVVTSAVRLTGPTQAAAKAKPICASPINPKIAAPVDCIPQQPANLPPDPGEASKLAIDGVDVDKDGIRDDVQRWIAENWGHSALAVKGLTVVAQVKLLEVHHGEDLGKAETLKLGPELARKAICAVHLETEAMQNGRAYDRLKSVVTNTPERWKRSRDFDQLFANSILALPDDTPAEACGFDPAALAVQAGEQTWAAKTAAERPEQQK